MAGQCRCGPSDLSAPRGIYTELRDFHKLCGMDNRKRVIESHFLSTLSSSTSNIVLICIDRGCLCSVEPTWHMLALLLTSRLMCQSLPLQDYHYKQTPVSTSTRLRLAAPLLAAIFDAKSRYDDAKSRFTSNPSMLCHLEAVSAASRDGDV
ncbi:hypothetical protein RRG08_021051 [Elysia crispata]|uniref:Uncharacterized protein n=1 Tax=Elysia crispata TaxID=231223 RepID=A0AAE0Z050_9GAST|nr:hypothetical protein RRG08_021051 [Elysia crispata]